MLGITLTFDKLLPILGKSNFSLDKTSVKK